MLVEELRAHDELRGHELTIGPEGTLVDEDLAAALLHEARGPRLGDPGAGDGTALEAVERGGVLLRHDGDVAAPVDIGGEPLVLEPRPQRHVLCAAELR